MIEEQESVDTVKRDRKEYNKQYYKKNRQKQLENVHKYYDENSDKVKEYKKQFYKLNREKILKEAKQRYQKKKNEKNKILIEI